MAQLAKKQWQFALRLEHELQTKLKEKDPLFDDIEHLIDQLRIACEGVLFLNFDYGTSERVEAHLWDAHGTINNRYRKIVATFKSSQLQKHVVEKRKWEKRYVDFLKKSQYFYKGYIQRLASHFAGLSELNKIAHRLQLSTLTVDDRVQVSVETTKLILLSCHATLLRLGDLSRYRNVIRSKDRSWDKPLAYYSLANDLYPDSGNAFNQMAVISLSEGDHLNAVYHLYRALAIKEPMMMAQGNLTIEFKKIEGEWQNGGRKAVPGMALPTGKPGSVAAPLVSWFVRLHAKLYKGQEFSGHDELENEVLSQLTVLLKEQSLEGLLDRFVLINIAAEYFAAEKLRNNPVSENFQSYYFFLRLNIRMLFMLLQLLQTELAGSNDGEDAPDVTGKSRQRSHEIITAVIRRILASVRQYSIWLVASAVILTGMHETSPLNIHIKELWSIYCSTLTLLVAAFPPENLHGVKYLLEEDAETVGFIPLRDSTFSDPYTNESGLKPRITDPGIERQHPNLEMLSRVRDLLRDAMVLSTSLDKQNQKIAPIAMVHGEFHFLEDGLPMSNSVGDHSSERSISSISPPALVPEISYVARHLRDVRPPSVTASDSHQSMTTDMYRMVDDLVAAPIVPNKPRNHLYVTDDTSYDMHSSTAAEVFGPTIMDVNIRPASRHAGSPFTSLPGVFKTPFSPQPGELDATSSDRSHVAMRLSSLHVSNDQEHGSPDQLNAGGNRLSWGTPSKYLHQAPSQRESSEQLHQSLAQKFGAVSSGFSQSSSLYTGTPNDVPHRQGDLSMNNSTRYAGASGFERSAMLQSSLWNCSQPTDWTRHVPTPPGGQGG